MFRPWLSKNIREITRSTKRDYPPKKKKPWLTGNFAEMENFHEGTDRPFPYPVLPPKVKGDGCAGRVLRPLSQVEWESGEGGLPKDGDVKEFQASVTGAVGNVTYSMDPFWSEVNENGDVATIDPNTGLITLEEGVCQGSYPPWIIYRVCDDCGCSSGTIWLEDSSGDCCTAPCDPLPTVTGADDIVAGGSAQYTFNDAQGNVTWALDLTDGGGATIDSNGLVETTGASCGIAIVKGTDSCCGEFVKYVRLDSAGVNSGWVFHSSESCGVCATPDITCEALSSIQTKIVYTLTHCFVSGSAACEELGTGCNCGEDACLQDCPGEGEKRCIVGIDYYVWRCD